MEMSEIYNRSQWAYDIFLVNKAGAADYITGQSFTLGYLSGKCFGLVYYMEKGYPSHWTDVRLLWYHGV